MLIFSTNMLGVLKTKKYLTSVFKMKDFNEVDMILEIKIKRDNTGFLMYLKSNRKRTMYNVILPTSTDRSHEELDIFEFMLDCCSDEL